MRALYDARLACDGFIPDPAQLAAAERLDALRARLAEAERSMPAGLRRLSRLLGAAAPVAPVTGVYLWGPVGRGKTMLLDLFHRSLPPGQARRRHFHRFMQDLHAALRARQHERDPLAAIATELASTTRVLCLDELFVSEIADAMLLGRLLTGLIRGGVTLVATSNLPPGELYRGGLQRERFLPAIAALERHMDQVEVSGPADHRLRRLEQAGTWLTGASAGAQLESLWEQLAGGPGSGEPLEIGGREIPVRRREAGVLWLDFEAACVGARSTGDYIEIAREFHTLLLEGVPVMGPAEDDAARRFIALVDELYERNVRLAASAAAQPDALYRGTRLAFEFARTTSRLIEMRSREYLARAHLP